MLDTPDLFGPGVDKASKAKSLGQYFTPRWAAQLLVETLVKPTAGSYIVEPSCGPGAFLHALPDHVTAIGVEIDETLAEEARRSTGRQVISGDFRTADIPTGADLVLGNPPFELSVIDGMLNKIVVGV